MTMRLAEVVDRLLPLADHGDRQLLHRQIRHWSKLGFLGPTSELQDESGRHRRYQNVHVYRGALFVELSRYGLAKDFFEGISEWLEIRIADYRQRYRSEVFDDARKRIEVLVFFSPLRARGGGQAPWVTIRRGGDEVELPGISSWLVINLSMLLARL
jgi:hypothetical protein